MGFSINSTLKDLLADEKAKAILDRQQPGWTDDPQLQQAMGMTLKEIAGYSQGQVTDEMLKEVDEELGKL